MGILQARILEWIAMPTSRGSSQPRHQTQVFRIVGWFFTSWATREAQEYWSGWPIPTQGDLPKPGIEPGSPALQVDSLPAELPGLFRRNFWNGLSELGILISMSKRFQWKPSSSQNSVPCIKLNIQNYCINFRSMLLQEELIAPPRLFQKIMVSSQ